MENLRCNSGSSDWKNELCSEWIKSNDEVKLEQLLFSTPSKNFIHSKDNATTTRLEENVPKSKHELKRKAVWTDEDDRDIQLGEVKNESKHSGSLDHLIKEKAYKEYVSTKFMKIGSAPKWANLDYDVQSNSDEKLLASVGFLKKSSKAALQPENINIKRLRNLNQQTYAEGSISSIQFHPTSTVALVAGNSGIATIYAVDGSENKKLHSIKFNGYPINCARLYEGGSKAIFGSIKNYLFTYDLLDTSEKCHRFPRNSITQFAKFDISPCEKYLAVAGRFGEVHILDLKSKEIIHTFKQEGCCTSLKFSKNSERIFTHSEHSNINILNTRCNRIEHTFIDEGCLHGQCLDISSSGNLIATGSKEGVVNLYNYSNIFDSKHPKPMKTIYNLTTAISDVKFNSSSEILAFCSDSVPGAVKLLHCVTGIVYSNFPGIQNKLDKIKLIEFSPSSGYMSLGSTGKEVPLFRLKYFNNY